jgi:hypothetical protein
VLPAGGAYADCPAVLVSLIAAGAVGAPSDGFWYSYGSWLGISFAGLLVSRGPPGEGVVKRGPLV